MVKGKTKTNKKEDLEENNKALEAKEDVLELKEEALETKEEILAVKPLEEEEIEKPKRGQGFDKVSWRPKTDIGKKVKEGEITSLDQILDQGNKILEAEIVDALLPGLNTDLLLIGQSKGKFGGGQRRVFRQTQKKTMEGNKPKFGTIAVVGDSNGYVGIGYGKSKETVPAREKSFRNAKLNIIKIKRGCGSWQCGCRESHTIPFKVTGKCGSSVIKLFPAPKGTGLCVEKECAKILKLAGIKDVWSKTSGQTTKFNLIMACEKALKNLSLTKVNQSYVEPFGIVEGAVTITKNEDKENE